ncbi:MAG: glycosyltransferase family 4 protein [Acidobacteriota bacterium]|nr:glycosyltransferase family 4 protein [Acidobacteriota bacterium]
MHVVFVSYEYEPNMASLDDLLQTYATIRPWAEALRDKGADVTVFQRFRQNARIERSGVEYLLHKDQQDPRLRKWQWPRSFHRRIKQRSAEVLSQGKLAVVHFNGLHFPLQLRALRAALPNRSAIVVQHHAERPRRGLRRGLQRWGLGAADGFFFAAAEMASAWVADGLIRPDQPVYQVMEGSTDFRQQDRAAARARTGFSGDPILLWVGRLVALKDPLTVLRGFDAILQQRPGARLYMVYGSEDLLPEVRACIAKSRWLSGSVTLLGSRPHAELEWIYNSADYFVLGSHYEGSGFSLAEALACGAVPVVTDIPSFRIMTGEGTIGACWPPGDSAAFAAAFHRASSVPHPIQAERAAKFFEERLSYLAIGRAAIAAYRELAMKRAELIP